MKKFLKLFSLFLVFVLALSLTSCIKKGESTDEETGNNNLNVVQGATFPLNWYIGKTFTYGVTPGIDVAEEIFAPGCTVSIDLIFEYDGGAPEVAYELEYQASVEIYDEEFFSNPAILWKLDDGEWGSLDDLLEDLNKFNGGVQTKQYSPGELPDFNGKHTISYHWAFGANDLNDTEIGANPSSSPFQNVMLLFVIGAKQID